MDGLLPLIGALIISVVTGIVTFVFARAKGLPELDAQVDHATGLLISRMKDRIDLLEKDFTRCSTKLELVLGENNDLRDALVDLYREQGRPTPTSLKRR